MRPLKLKKSKVADGGDFDTGMSPEYCDSDTPLDLNDSDVQEGQSDSDGEPPSEMDYDDDGIMETAEKKDGSFEETHKLTLHQIDDKLRALMAARTVLIGFQLKSEEKKKKEMKRFYRHWILFCSNYFLVPWLTR